MRPIAPSNIINPKYSTLMKKIILSMLACLALASCTPTEQCGTATESQTEPSQIVEEVIMARRSIRAYKDVAVGRDTLDRIIKCGINAPNARGVQAYEVRVLSNPELVKAISDAVVSDNPKFAERPGFKNIFVGAPCVICIAAEKDNGMSEIDCGLLGENIILMAQSMGLGTCCLGSSPRMIKDSPSAAPYLQQLNFSEGYDLLYCIAIGYPDEQPDAKPRREDKVVYIE